MPPNLVTTQYGRPALDALRVAVAAAKGGDALAPVTVLVPTNSVGVVARRHLARPDGIAAVGFLTIYRLAELLAAPSLAAEGRRPVSSLVVGGALRRSLLERPGLFAPVAEHPATTTSLLAIHQELRDLPDTSLDRLAAVGSRRTREVVRLHRATVATLRPSWHDEADLLERATALVTTDPGLARSLGHVLVHLPQDVGRKATALIDALAHGAPCTVVLGLVGSDAADAGPRRLVSRLGLRASPVRPRAVTELEVIRTSDADEEARAVVRRLLDAARGADGQPVPLDRIAVLYPAPRPYGRLLAEHLDAAGIPWNGKASRPLHDRVAGRTLLGLLDLSRRGATRADVFALLADGPTRAVDGRPAPVGRWERVSRDAGVVGGHADWRHRLAIYAEAAEQDADALESDVERAGAAGRRRLDAALARSLAAEVDMLLSAFPDEGASSTWSELARRAGVALRRVLGGEAARATWPADEVRAAEQVDAVLERVSHLDVVDPAPDLARFRAAVTAELDSDLGKRGRLGEGVHVGPLASALGLDVELLVVVGMAEGTLPTRTADDSLVPDREREHVGDDLPRSTQRAVVQARLLHAAIASARRSVLVQPRGDLRRSGALVASRWLRGIVGLETGGPVTTDEWEAMQAPWLTHVHSFADGVRRAVFPATAQEHRLRRLDRQVTAGGRLHETELDPVLRAGVALVRARASDDFTPWDGNLAGVALAPLGDQPLSASRIEAWLACPHAYFLRYLLGVEPVENPEDVLRMPATEQGSLVHDVLERLVLERGAMAYGEAWSRGDHERLDALLDEVAVAYERRGVVGRPLYWRSDRARLRRDLHALLVRDTVSRRHAGRRPEHAELAFGFADALPAAEVVTPSGRRLHFRGRVDRVDCDERGVVYVIDYKTGSGHSYKGIGPEAPFGPANSRVQLPVYAQAARLVAPGAPAVVAEYLFVSANRERDTAVLPVDDEVTAAFGSLLDSVADAIEAGTFPAHPPAPVWARYVQCRACDPDGLGTAARHRTWERKRRHPTVAAYATLVGDAGDGHEAGTSDG